ncbi:unnamed protein product [Leptidea sinapis]|uniref:STAT transcription factor protein interaction domain-containing protein n=1 Tax=Leptidea sinapis TaxID=189913 RepID=A0A5E4QLV6_9NEOP|nr:unnamed protein product [Leptidea sinapis]
MNIHSTAIEIKSNSDKGTIEGFILCKTPEPEEQQRFFVEELVQEIHTNAELMVSPELFVTKMKLLEAAKLFRLHYSHNPHELYTYMRRCLALEMEVIQNAMGPYVAQPQTERKYSEMELVDHMKDNIANLRQLQSQVLDEELIKFTATVRLLVGGQLNVHMTPPRVTEPHGWATVTWDNAFSPPGRIPFAVPDKNEPSAEHDGAQQYHSQLDPVLQGCAAREELHLLGVVLHGG